MLAHDQTGIGCTILDESDGGVQVQTARPLDLPEQVFIKFSNQASQLVRRCWANGTRAGYQYIEIVPAKRNQQDVPPNFPDTDSAAVNDFLRIAHALLALSDRPEDWAHQSGQIDDLLANIPHVRLQLTQSGGFTETGLQLLAIPKAKNSYFNARIP